MASEQAPSGANWEMIAIDRQEKLQALEQQLSHQKAMRESHERENERFQDIIIDLRQELAQARALLNEMTTAWYGDGFGLGVGDSIMGKARAFLAREEGSNGK